MHSHFKAHAMLIAAVFLGQLAVAGAQGDKAAAPNPLPATIVPWENVTKRIESPEVVILCLVDSYRPEQPSTFGPGELTPAQMLERYLAGVRTLGLNSGDKPADGVNYQAKVKILVVECGYDKQHEPTREKASQLHKQFKIPSYDRTIPVIYVFHKGKFVETYTYDKSPGFRGETLRDLVTGLLKPKDAQGAAKAPAKVGR